MNWSFKYVSSVQYLNNSLRSIKVGKKGRYRSIDPWLPQVWVLHLPQTHPWIQIPSTQQMIPPCNREDANFLPLALDPKIIKIISTSFVIVDFNIFALQILAKTK